MRALLSINHHTTFEVRSFTDSKNMIVLESQALDIFDLHTKFGDCRFSRSGHMIASVEIEKWVT